MVFLLKLTTKKWFFNFKRINIKNKAKNTKLSFKVIFLAENFDNDFDEKVEDITQADNDETDVNDVNIDNNRLDDVNNEDKLDEETLKLIELLKDSMKDKM